MRIFVTTMESIEFIFAYGTGSTRLRWGTGGRYQGNQGEQTEKDAKMENKTRQEGS